MMITKQTSWPLLLAILLIPAPGVASEKLEERIEQGCVSMLKMKSKQAGKVCACVRKNLALKLDDKELELIARAYEGDEKAEKEIEKEENESLSSFDADVAEECLANPKFTISDK